MTKAAWLVWAYAACIFWGAMMLMLGPHHPEVWFYTIGGWLLGNGVSLSFIFYLTERKR